MTRSPNRPCRGAGSCCPARSSAAALLIVTIYALVAVVLTWLPSYFEVGLGYSAMQAGSMFALPSIVGLILMIISSVSVTACSPAASRLASFASSSPLSAF